MADTPDLYADLAGEFGEIVAPDLDSRRESDLYDAFRRVLDVEEAQLGDETGPPRLSLLGRSGAGKSSLINALADDHLATVGAVEPTTAGTEVYDVTFVGWNTEWQLVDSRGLFESIPVDGAVPVDTVEELAADLDDHPPDFLLHVLTPDQVRAGDDDFAALDRLNEAIVGGLPPRIVCLNQVDVHLPPGGAWPPDENAPLADDIVETLRFVAEVLDVPVAGPYLDVLPFRGLLFDSERVLGAVPTYAREDPYWNVETLRKLLCEYLPAEGSLTSARAQRRERVGRRLARRHTEAIAAAVGEVSRSEVTTSNQPVVASYQRYLVALVGRFAGAEFGAGTVADYDEAVESLADTQSRFRTTLDRAVDYTLSPLGKSLENLQAQTYAIGRSAEAYFFDDEVVSPAQFREDALPGRITTQLDDLDLDLDL